MNMNSTHLWLQFQHEKKHRKTQIHCIVVGYNLLYRGFTVVKNVQNNTPTIIRHVENFVTSWELSSKLKSIAVIISSQRNCRQYQLSRDQRYLRHFDCTTRLCDNYHARLIAVCLLFCQKIPNTDMTYENTFKKSNFNLLQKIKQFDNIRTEYQYF